MRAARRTRQSTHTLLASCRHFASHGCKAYQGTHTHTHTHTHAHTHTHTQTQTHFTRVLTEVRSGESIIVALNCVELKFTRNCIPSLSLPVNFQVEFERAGGTASGLVPVAHGAPFQLEGQLIAHSGTVPRLPTCVVSQCTLRPGPGRRLMLRRQCAH